MDGNERDDEYESAVKRGEKNIRVRINNYFRQGLPREEVLIQMCRDFDTAKTDFETAAQISREFNVIEMDYETVKRYFEDENCEQECWFGPNQWDLLKKTAEEYGKYKNVISVAMNIDKFQLMNSRYAISMDYYDVKHNQIALLDNFHGKRRHIPVNNAFFEDEDVIKRHLVVLDLYLLLFILEYSESFTVHLCQLDLVANECKSIGSETINEHYRETIVDSANQHAFVLVSMLPTTLDHNLWIGRVEDHRLVVDRPSISFIHPEKIRRLNGNKFQELILTVRNNPNIPNAFQPPFAFRRSVVQLLEHTLVPGQQQARRHLVGEIEGPSEGDWRKSIINYFWIDQSCYMLKTNSSTNQVSLIIFNVETLSFKVTKCLQVYCFHEANGLHMDENTGILTVCAEDTSLMQVVYRFNMRSPESLSNLTLFAIRRSLMFCKNEMYKQMLCKLPNRLMPFAICQPQLVIETEALFNHLE
ncbi:hypothetical protein M3Y97_00914300 [Aphelenchoides bicaudatus]|nr:hypothetical protein M3Y97_00914300 [Aphelenchoides bicaudatus]